MIKYRLKSIYGVILIEAFSKENAQEKASDYLRHKSGNALMIPQIEELKDTSSWQETKLEYFNNRRDILAREPSIDYTQQIANDLISPEEYLNEIRFW